VRGVSPTHPTPEPRSTVSETQPGFLSRFWKVLIDGDEEPESSAKETGVVNGEANRYESTPFRHGRSQGRTRRSSGRRQNRRENTHSSEPSAGEKSTQAARSEAQEGQDSQKPTESATAAPPRRSSRGR